MSSKPRIGMIGLGLMGHGIAKNLVSKGYPLTARAHHNRKPLEDLLALGAKEAATNAAVAQASDIVILCVTGAPQVEEIIHWKDGIMSVARDGLIVVDTSTSEPSLTAALRDALASKGTRFVDAPLARTPVEAEQGRLNTMVGADDATFEQLKPVLAAYCENIFHAGPPGHGHILMFASFSCASISDATYLSPNPSRFALMRLWCTASPRACPCPRSSARPCTRASSTRTCSGLATNTLRR